MFLHSFSSCTQNLAIDRQRVVDFGVHVLIRQSEVEQKGRRLAAFPRRKETGGTSKPTGAGEMLRFPERTSYPFSFSLVS